VYCRVKPGEPTAGNDYSCRFHATLMNGIVSSYPEIDQKNENERS
jgi:hypothetical protein